MDAPWYVELMRYRTSPWEPSDRNRSTWHRRYPTVVGIVEILRGQTQHHYRVLDQRRGRVLWDSRDGWLVPIEPWMVGETPPINDEREEPGHMEVSNPLHVPRQTLIDKIKGNIADRKAEHDAKVAEARAKREGKIAEVAKALEEVPLGLLRMIEQVYGTVYSDPGEGQGLTERLKAGFPEDEPAPFKDSNADKLVSVLEAATDKEIEVTPNDDLYRYL